MYIGGHTVRVYVGVIDNHRRPRYLEVRRRCFVNLAGLRGIFNFAGDKTVELASETIISEILMLFFAKDLSSHHGADVLETYGVTSHSNLVHTGFEM